eukprot:2928533-Pleurochrysis_carterae.AAC.1
MVMIHPNQKVFVTTARGDKRARDVCVYNASGVGRVVSGMRVRESQRVSRCTRMAGTEPGTAERGRHVSRHVGEIPEAGVACVEPAVHVFGRLL